MSISFDRAVEYYDSTRGYPPEIAAAIGAALIEAAEATPRTRFLELGVGTGRIALPIIAQGHDYTGVDISAAMMDRLRAKLVDLERETGRTPRANLLEADAQALPFDGGSFDAVLAVHVFHLVSDPCAAWHEAFRVLRPGGALLICADAVADGEPVSINEVWRDIVRAARGQLPSSVESAAEVISQIEAEYPGLPVDELRPVHWEFTRTVGEELEMIRQRLWSNTWALSDALFESCLARLSAWCAEQYAGRMETPLPRRAEFVIRRVRRPADR